MYRKLLNVGNLQLNLEMGLRATYLRTRTAAHYISSFAHNTSLRTTGMSSPRARNCPFSELKASKSS